MALLAITTPVSECASHAPMEIDQNFEYHVRDLGTRLVTLFPTHASIIRDIKNIPLRVRFPYHQPPPGTKLSVATVSVTILGLTPTLDENSVTVEVTNNAIITNFDIELLPNPESSDKLGAKSIGHDRESDDSDSDWSVGNKEDQYQLKNPKYKALVEKKRKLEEEQKVAEEAIRIAEERLVVLMEYKERIAAGNPGYPETSFADAMKTFETESARASRDITEQKYKILDLTTELLTVHRLKLHRYRRLTREYERIRDAKSEQKKNKMLKKNARLAENERLRRERELRFPAEVYAITISIDVNAASEDAQGTYNLTLKYATANASWSPTYDMALSTATNSGVLYFDASLTNLTSETWEGCNIVLSTPETNPTSHTDTIPTLQPWHVSVPSKKHISAIRGILFSEDEKLFPAKQAKDQDPFSSARSSRKLTFPDPSEDRATPRTGGLFDRALMESRKPFGTTRRIPQRTASISGKENIDPAVDDGSLLVGDDSPSHGRSPPDQQIALFRDEGNSNADDDASTVSSQQNADLGEHSLEELEFATTYSLAGKRSLAPSLRMSKHRVDRIHYADVLFTRTVVPKHKRTVFLRAEMRNDSNICLPKSVGGLTVDGRFIGRSTLPRWAPGVSLCRRLGIDPSIRVAYPKPEARHSSR
ncbi:hypothetical protein ONZ43_g5433 [Nemania bipapillata]|uniref:Uncharacterized protein n=1 Tax=Nemania bipapillata TaxID=110536 RepID=A0ACC2IAT8_9PEZI|nr:hypothetical protein ONZ43_g5433 [Nemania bipapillata]